MGALTADRARRRARPPAPTSRVWRPEFLDAARGSGPRRSASARGSTSSTTAAWAGSATATRARSPRSSSAAPPTSGVELAGLWTHFATADEPDSAFFDEQLERFAALAERAARASIRGCSCTPPTAPRPCASPASHFDMVRCGIAIYGLDPFGERPGRARARAGAGAALLRRRREARSSAGDSAGYGRTLARAGRRPGSACCRSATATASGAALSNNADVLVGGRRHPLVGTISMDNITIDLGAETDVEPGRRGGADRRPGRGADPRRGGRRAGSARSTTRSPAGSRRGCRASLGAMSVGDPTTRLLAAAGGRRPRARRSAGAASAWIVGGAVRDARSAATVVDLDLAVAGDRARRRAAIAARRRRATRSSSRPSSAPGGRSPATAPGTSTSAALRGESIEADLAAARLHRQRDRACRSPTRRRADRPDRRARRPRGAAPAGGLRAQLRRRPAADPARGAARRRARASSSSPGPLELARASAARAGEPAGRAPVRRAAAAGRRARPAARARAARRARGDRGRCCPSSRRCAASSQNPNHHLDVHGHTLEVLAQPARGRGATSSATPATRRPRSRALLAEPLADELTRGDGAALRRPPPRRRQARDPRSSAAASSPSSATTASGAEIVARAPARRLKASRALSRHLEALTLHHLRLGFMVHERPLPRRRVYDYLRADRAGRPPTSPCSRSPTGSRPAAAGRRRRAEMIEAHLELAREMLRRGARLAPRRPAARRRSRGDELAAALGIEPGPELGRLLAEIEAARVRRRGRRPRRRDRARSRLMRADSLPRHAPA